MNTIAKIANAITSVVLIIAGLLNLIGTLNETDYLNSGVSQIILAFWTDLIFSIFFMAFGFLIAIQTAKGNKNISAYPLQIFCGTYYIIGCSLIIDLYNEAGLVPPSSIIACLIFAILCTICGLFTYITKNNKNRYLPLVGGIAAGFSCFICSTIFFSESNSSSSTIFLTITSLFYIGFILADCLSLSPHKSDTNEPKKTSKEHLPSEGRAYTPEEYYELTGIKKRQDNEDEK